MNSKNKQELIERAKELNDKEKYREVIDLLPHEILEKYNDYELYAELSQAKCRLHQSDYVKFAQKSLDIISNPKAFNYLGNYYKANDELDKAEELYQKALEMDETFFLAYNNLGMIYSQKNDYNRSKDYFKKSLLIDQHHSTYTALGSMYRLKKDYPKAEESYNKAIELNSDASFAYNGLGNIMMDKGDFPLAIEHYTEAIGKEIVLGFHYNRALCYFFLKDYDKALLDFKEVEKGQNRADFFYEESLFKIQEINKIFASEDYEKIQEIVNKIKNVLEYKETCITHFTSLTVAKALIFQNSKFRLSEGAFLNDTSEGRELFTYLNHKSPFGKKENPVDEIFVQKPFIGSFVSQHKHNDLTMWRMYGKEGKEEARGCAITMDLNLLIESTQQKLEIVDANKIDIKFYKVAYWKDSKFIIPDENFSGTKVKNLNKYCNELKIALNEFNKKDEEIKIQIDIEELLFEIAFLFKGIEYQYEHEVRLVQKGISFERKVDKSFEIPRVYIELVDVSKCIKKITLGPKVERADEWAAALYYELQNKEIEAEIHISRQPFK